MEFNVSSMWAGKYSKTKHGITNSLVLAIWWFISWSIIEFKRVLKLNKYHYGNILGVGRRKFIICPNMHTYYKCYDYDSNINKIECDGCIHAKSGIGILDDYQTKMMRLTNHES